MDDSLASASLLLESLVNHIALPPRLQGKRDDQIDQIELALANRLLDGSRTLRDLTSGNLSHEWDCIRQILQTCNVVNAGGTLDKSSLLTEFERLEPKDILILHVAEQNAGLLIWRHRE